MPEIFLSYRRDDSEETVARIYDQLVDRFGSGSVFKDADSIKLGTDFRESIRQALTESKAVLVVIGKQWLAARTDDGQRRLDDRTDFVQLEIASALRHGKRVIPVLVGNAQMPQESELPENIRQLAFLQGLQVRTGPNFPYDMSRLIKALEENTAALNARAALPMARPHQEAALLLHIVIICIFGILALTAIGGGIYAISTNATSATTLKLLGADFSTGHVGVALVGIGFIITFFTVRSVLKSQRDLAALPKDDD